MSEAIRELVLKSSPAVDLAAQAEKEGMGNMRDAGVRKVLEGVTTPEEVLRVLYVED
jgi:type IV pilus assembly protein PilB